MSKYVGIVIKKDKKYLFVRRALTRKLMPGIMMFPSGTIEEGELPIQTAIRETKEELNLNTFSAKILSKVEIKEINVHLTFVLCEVDGYKITHDIEEIDEVIFMTLDDFFKRFTDEEMGHGLQKIRRDRSLIK